MLSAPPCFHYTAQLLLRCWQLTLLHIHSFFQLFQFSRLLPQIEKLWVGTVYAAVFFYSPFHLPHQLYPLKDSSWHVLWLNPFHHLRAFTFNSYSFRWHQNLCPSVKATVHHLHMSSMLASDLSFSLPTSKFLLKRSSLYPYKHFQTFSLLVLSSFSESL